MLGYTMYPIYDMPDMNGPEFNSGPQPCDILRWSLPTKRATNKERTKRSPENGLLLLAVMHRETNMIGTIFRVTFH